MKNYTLGFCFNEERSSVLLIKKTHPKWQEGLLNGIGGEIESESPQAAMEREFCEETGVNSKVDWKYFGKMRGVDFTVFCFKAFDNVAYSGAASVTEEQIVVVDVKKIHQHQTITNLPWLIAMALDRDDFTARVDYGGIGNYYPLASIKDVEDFISEVGNYIDNPENWPLTPAEQSRFTRMVLHKVNKLRNTDAYRQMKLINASEALVKFEGSRGGGKTGA